ncbi:MAG: hypothetical protein ICV61_17015 [Microcoleus sp. Co-bin12]|nr:hypothetical protein [Microcoleus sp. Co-bin12]
MSSFTWLDDRTFQANIVCGDRADCTEAPFRGNISTSGGDKRPRMLPV